MSMPSFFSGRSMIWPTVARTRYARPRYFPIVFAFAGDSTITSEVDPAGAAGYSSASATLRPRAVVFLAAAFFTVVFLAAVFFAAVLFLAAMVLVYGLSIRRGARILESGSIHHGAQVVERDAAVELQHRPLDYLLELRGVERSGAGQREQMAPRLGGESATLMRSQNANGH